MVLLKIFDRWDCNKQQDVTNVQYIKRKEESIHFVFNQRDSPMFNHNAESLYSYKPCSWFYVYIYLITKWMVMLCEMLEREDAVVYINYILNYHVWHN